MMQKRIGLYFIICTIAMSCSNQAKKQNNSVNGVWKSLGSGNILEITDSLEYKFFDITSISCLPRRNGGFIELTNFVDLNEDTLRMRTGVSTYSFTRIEKMPTLCNEPLQQSKAEDPLFNFEVFAKTVEEHYVFFELNNIDWKELYQKQKEKLHQNSTEVELYKVLEETLELLNDNHAFLEATDEVYKELESEEEVNEQVLSEDQEALPEYGDFQIANMVTKHHLIEKMTDDSWLVDWGKLEEDIGFIQLKAMWLHADLNIPQELIDDMGYVDAYVETFHQMYEGDYVEKEIAAVSKTMDKIMDDLIDMKSIVIDVRFNGGGQDAVSFEILSRFIAETDLQVAKQKLRQGNGYTSTLPLFIKGKKMAFTKPIYVLTSPKTASAAESFAIVTMAMKNAKRIGSSTEGALSTALEKTLPNKWVFSISNEIYMDNNDKFYENIGVPVDYELAYPRGQQDFFRSVAKDLEGDKKSILKAIDHLTRNK